MQCQGYLESPSIANSPIAARQTGTKPQNPSQLIEARALVDAEVNNEIIKSPFILGMPVTLDKIKSAVFTIIF